MMRTHWCSGTCTETGSGEARRPPERAETYEEIRTSKWSDQACWQAVAEMHSESEAHPWLADEPMRTAAEDADTRRGLKISAELPLDDGARDRAPCRGEHLDDNVPIATPVVQQAEQAADAADAHKSVGKMEMISRATAMTNSAAAGELTGAGI